MQRSGNSIYDGIKRIAKIENQAGVNNLDEISPVEVLLNRHEMIHDPWQEPAG